MPAGVPEPHLSAWRAVLNAHAVLVDRIEHELALANLPPLSWYDVLWAVRKAPGRRIRMAQLADSLTVSRGGLTKLADRLEREGLLRREPADDDGRGFYATITDEGIALLRQMWTVYSRVLRQSFASSMDEREARVIASALARAERATRTGTSAPRQPSDLPRTPTLSGAARPGRRRQAAPQRAIRLHRASRG